MARLLRPRSRDDFEIAIICALPIERDAIEALLDEEYETDGFSYGKSVGDQNAYTTGRMGYQHVVLAYLPGMGMVSAAAVAAHLRSSFEKIRIGIVAGICGGVPTTADGTEILLGDVLISTSVIQVDLGRQYPNKLVRKAAVEDTLGRVNPEIRSFVGKMSGRLASKRLKKKTNVYSAQISTKEGFSKSIHPGPEKDQLYPAWHRHKHWREGVCSICDNCYHLEDDVCQEALQAPCAELGCDKSERIKRKRPQGAMGINPGDNPISAAENEEAQQACIHFGRLACSSQVMKSGQHRDRIAQIEGVIGFEMESAGTWDYIPTVVIKSVSSYADSHGDKNWQEYAAAVAAGCTKAVLEEWRSVDRPIQGDSEMPPRPTLLVSLRRDLDFVDRGSLLDQVHQRSSVPGSETTLVGSGGTGGYHCSLEKKLDEQANRQDLAELAHELEFMPLAIVQAAAHTSQPAPRCPVQQRINKFRRSDREKVTLLNHERNKTSSGVLRAKHRDTLTSMANLASAYWEQGRWKEAEELFKQVIETRSRVLGAEHSNR
ncbi:hypothetical protein GP486_004976 [Trichoglossum hirsutum]|uniref:Nucleoside phosphorylase domain-containing protein n=1 Tax=Trichoglossum hirsutum TaxID=265104 RepID=A0A9P8RNN8_9PEZI|nr:hypothetical protein GP486_004976 [Trichoglossum hirsutum]